jgi:hypothetical protein
MITRLTAAAVLLFALVGCADSGGDEDDSNSNSNSEYDTAAAELMEQVYLTNLRNEHPEAFMAVQDSVLLDIGHRVCDSFDAGMTWMEASLKTLKVGYTPEQGGWLLGSAITAFCPEHSDLMS